MMFSRWFRSIVAVLFAPVVALCLVTSMGCEEEGLEMEDENGVEVEDGDLE